MRKLVLDKLLNIGYDRYFHVSISGQEAEEMLQNEPNGTFLVRESTSLTGEFALTVKNDDSVLHVRIYHDNCFFRIVPRDNFRTLTSLVEHYFARPMIQHCGNAVHLKQALLSTRFTALYIDERIDCLLALKKGKMRDGIVDEFEKLHGAKGIHLFFSSKEGRTPENVLKNRYRNVVPYDHTRVKLKYEHLGITEINDYINANRVNVLTTEPMYSEFEGMNKRYISTQGCLSNTVDAFWYMVWQENSRMIVMTTKEEGIEMIRETDYISDKTERGRSKCYKYWPDENDEGADNSVFGVHKEFKIRTVSKEDRGEYITRIFEVTRLPKEILRTTEPETRQIYHFQFLGWEDQYCPSEQLLTYIEDINVCEDTKLPRDCGPMIVHCSAGIGRTGTFIVLDILLRKIKMQGIDAVLDVFKTVRMVREQRATMVQTEAQYRFIYEAISRYMNVNKKTLISEEDKEMRCLLSKAFNRINLGRFLEFEHDELVPI